RARALFPGSSSSLLSVRSPSTLQVGEPQFEPLHASLLDGIAEQAFARREGRGPGLHLDEYDRPDVLFVEAVEDDEVHRLAQELCVLRIPFELREVRDELFGHQADRRRLAALDRVATNIPGIQRLPALEAEAEREIDDQNGRRDQSGRDKELLRIHGSAVT